MILSQPATCLPDHCFCEAVRHVGIMQPVDAYSSIAFVIVGCFIALRYRTWFSYLFSAALLIVGFGSYYYHAHLTLLTQAIDNIGMYLVVLIPITLLIYKKFSLTKIQATLLFILFFIASLPVLLIYHGARRFELGILIVILLALDFLWSNTHRRYLYTALGIFLVSFAIWILDFSPAICRPESIIQGHAIWHVFNALAAYFLFRHYEAITTVRDLGFS